MSDVFDLRNVSDIPDEIKKELNTYSLSDRILELFDIAKRNLSVDEVVVAYFRKFNEVKTKKQIMSKLYSMSKTANAKIKSVSGCKGVYSKIGEKK